jgi:hypothetical protein
MLAYIWRKRVRVERTGDGVTRRPPVLKTVRFTGAHALPKFTEKKPQIHTDLHGSES